MGFIRESSEKPLITSFFLISFQIPVSVRLSYRLAVKEYAGEIWPPWIAQIHSFYKAAYYDAAKNDVEDLANALIRFENGASLKVDVSFTLHAVKNETSMCIFGDKGGAQVEPELQIVGEKYDTMLNLLPQIDSLSFNVVSGFQNEIDHFIQSCLGRTETLSPVEDGVEMMKMLCAVYESAESGKEIRFDETRWRLKYETWFKYL